MLRRRWKCCKCCATVYLFPCNPVYSEWYQAKNNFWFRANGWRKVFSLARAGNFFVLSVYIQKTSNKAYFGSFIRRSKRPCKLNTKLHNKSIWNPVKPVFWNFFVNLVNMVSAVGYFHKESSMIDVWLSSKYAFGYVLQTLYKLLRYFEIFVRFRI